MKYTVFQNKPYVLFSKIDCDFALFLYKFLCFEVALTPRSLTSLRKDSVMVETDAVTC